MRLFKSAEEIAGVTLTSHLLRKLRDALLLLQAGENSLDRATLRSQLGSLSLDKVVDLVERAVPLSATDPDKLGIWSGEAERPAPRVGRAQDDPRGVVVPFVPPCVRPRDREFDARFASRATNGRIARDRGSGRDEERRGGDDDGRGRRGGRPRRTHRRSVPGALRPQGPSIARPIPALRRESLATSALRGSYGGGRARAAPWG